MDGPLQNCRVIEWSPYMQGPLATRFLADLGAEVIKVENRVKGDPARQVTRWEGLDMQMKGGRHFNFEHHNRNKKSVSLDMRKGQAHAIVCRLVKKSDVIVFGYRKRVVHKLGLDYDTLSKHNPMLVYVNTTGYGLKGPDAQLPAYDYTTQARSGMMSVACDPDRPPKLVPGYIGDTMGAIMTSYGILAALVARQHSGQGQQIEASAMGSLAFLESLNISAYLHFGQQLPKYDRADAPMPLWNHYRCSDGKWLAMALIQSDKYWRGFCGVLDLAHIENDPRFENEQRREENSAALISILDEVFMTRPRAEWLRLFKERGDYVVAPVNTLADIMADEQMRANNYILDYDHPDLGSTQMVGFPVGMSKTPVESAGAAPHLGEHTRQVLSEIAGYTENEIEAFGDQEVI